MREGGDCMPFSSSFESIPPCRNITKNYIWIAVNGNSVKTAKS
jgi:hypothetical protein